MKTWLLFVVAGVRISPQKPCTTLDVGMWLTMTAQQYTENTPLRFHFNSGYANASQYYIVHTLPILFMYKLDFDYLNGDTLMV
jgi:hypothetical protein